MKGLNQIQTSKKDLVKISQLLETVFVKSLSKNNFNYSNKKVYLEKLNTDLGFDEGTAINLRWGKKLSPTRLESFLLKFFKKKPKILFLTSFMNLFIPKDITTCSYNYICIHITKSEITFPHNKNLKNIKIKEMHNKSAELEKTIGLILNKYYKKYESIKKGFDYWKDDNCNYNKINNIYNKLKRESILGDYSVKKVSFYKKLPLFLVSIPYNISGKIYYASSLDFSFKSAFIKACIEAIEWYKVNYENREGDQVCDNFSKIKKYAINPELFKIHEVSRIKKAEYFIFNRLTQFNYSYVQSIPDKKVLMLPTQFIYSGYPFPENEKIIRVPISTGAAGGFTPDFSLLNGLLEIIERDHFSLFYSSKISPVNIDYSSCKFLTEVSKTLQLQDFKMYALDFSYDFPVYIIGVMLVNELKSIIRIGLAADFNLNNCINKATLEAIKQTFNKQTAASNSTEEIDLKNLSSIFKNNSDKWKNINLFEKIEFLISGDVKKYSEYKSEYLEGYNEQTRLESLIRILKNNNYEILVKTFPDDKFSDLYISKIIIPQLLPLYLSNQLPFKLTPRIKEFLKIKKGTYPKSPPPPSPFF